MSKSKRICLRIIIFFGLLILTVCIGITKSLDLKQNDYQLKFERMELARYNKLYLKSYKATTFKYNRTCPVVNVTLEYNVELGFNLEIITQAYVFLSNEYREFPLRLEVNFCEAISKNYIGIGGLTKCGNFSGCPLKKARIYHYCNWTPDQSQFPPFIPDGKYMLELQGLYYDKEVFVMRFYATVDRPIRIPGIGK